MNKHLRKSVLLILFTGLFLVALLSDTLYPADMLLCDSAYQKLESQTRDIQIITIDEKTEAAYGRFESWSREKLSALLTLLSEDPAAAPAVVALDILFIGESDIQTDARLVQAAQIAGNVVCASNLIYSGRLEEDLSGNLYYNSAAIEREERPFNAFSDAVAVGFANTCISEDNVVRYAQLHALVNGQRRDSLAYTAYKAYAQAKQLPVTDPATKGGQIGFFYSGNPGDIPHVSLVDVLEGTVPVSTFSGKLVFVGVYAPGFQDAYSASVARGQQMYGVEINANIVLALLNGKLAAPVPVLHYGLLCAALLALWIFFLDGQKLIAVLAEALALCGLHMLTGRLLAHSGYLIPQVYFIAIVLLAVVYFIVQKYIIEKARRRHAIGTLKKYVAPQIVEKLSKDGSFELHLGGEKKHVAVVFCDVRGFTTMSEALPPEEVVRILNQYLSVTTAAVFKNEGTLDKFIGDATMAVFNAPFDLEDYVFKAVKTAWDIQSGVLELAKTMDRSVNVGVGVNCGEAVVGNIGCQTRMDYTAIGDTVNTAARLESNAKAGQILISQAVYQQISHRITAEPMGELPLKGKNERVSVYNVTGFLERAAIEHNEA